MNVSSDMDIRMHLYIYTSRKKHIRDDLKIHVNVLVFKDE
jgi:hypothetical protein